MSAVTHLHGLAAHKLQALYANNEPLACLRLIDKDRNEVAVLFLTTEEQIANIEAGLAKARAHLTAEPGAPEELTHVDH